MQTSYPARILPRKLVNPAYAFVNFLISGSETNGEYAYVEVDLPPGEGTPMHYHLDFEEEFEAIDGILGIQIGKETIHLRPGQKPAVMPVRAPHRFFNPGNTFIRFRALVKPAKRFETLLRIVYGLADDGLCNEKGMPKSLLHRALVYEIGGSYLPQVPLFLQEGIFGMLAKIARWSGKDKGLEKYYVGQVESARAKKQPALRQQAKYKLREAEELILN